MVLPLHCCFPWCSQLCQRQLCQLQALWLLSFSYASCCEYLLGRQWTFSPLSPGEPEFLGFLVLCRSFRGGFVFDKIDCQIIVLKSIVRVPLQNPKTLKYLRRIRQTCLCWSQCHIRYQLLMNSKMIFPHLVLRSQKLIIYQNK